MLDFRNALVPPSLYGEKKMRWNKYDSKLWLKYREENTQETELNNVLWLKFKIQLVRRYMSVKNGYTYRLE